MSSTFGATASDRAMHSRCCWPPESAPPGLVEPIAHLPPQAGPLERLLDQCILVVATDVGQLQPGQHVVPDAHGRERVGLLEDHADAGPDCLGAHVGAVDVLAIEQDLAVHGGPGTSSCIRLSRRRKVDLPQPEGPMRAVTSPAAIDQGDALEDQVVAEPGAGVPCLEGGGPGRRATDQSDRRCGSTSTARGPPWARRPVGRSIRRPSERFGSGWGSRDRS